MLKTLDKYIEQPERGRKGLLSSLYRRDPRFAWLLMASIIGHIVFYAGIVMLDSISMRHRTARAARRVQLVQIAELAPPPDRLPELRRAPDPIERADVSRLHFDPNDADDINLVARSPRPSTARRAGGRLSAPSQTDKQVGKSRGTGLRAAVSELRSPPQTATPELSGAPRPDAPLVAETSLRLPALPAPVPPARSDVSRPIAGTQPSAGGRGGDGADTAALGLQRIQAQYLAYVRAKIRMANERIMPRNWIAEVLTKKVSADFEVLVGRGGQFISSQLRRSSGYPNLDDTARNAIYIASPFEGFPSDAGDSLTLTVTVYYSPWR